MPPARKIDITTINPVSKVITGKPELFGNVKVPIEQRQTPPMIIAAMMETTKMA